MGPGSWLAIARALGLTLARVALDPRKGGAAVLLNKIRAHIAEEEYEMAKVKLRHLKKRHQDVYDKFMDEFGDDLDL